MNWLKVGLLISITFSTCAYLSLKFFYVFALKTVEILDFVADVICYTVSLRPEAA